MSSYCRSCGSTVDADATVCPVCGERLDGASEEVMAESTGTPTATNETGTGAAASGTAVPGTARERRTICGECGGENDPGASFCQFCGESLTGARPSRAATPPPAAKKSGGIRDYLIMGGIAAALALVVFLVATPGEQTGPPLPAQQQAEGQGQGQGALPPGHPPAEGQQQPPTPTPEQQQRIAELEKRVKEQPDDNTAKVDLANIYYDLERHADAIPLYRSYLEKNPDDPDARTDMAYSIASSGDLPGAIVELNRVTKANPQHQNSAYNLAIMYLSTRNRDSTTAWLRHVVAIDSTTRQGQLASQLLNELEHAHGAGAPADSGGH